MSLPNDGSFMKKFLEQKAKEEKAKQPASGIPAAQEAPPRPASTKVSMTLSKPAPKGKIAFGLKKSTSTVTTKKRTVESVFGIDNDDAVIENDNAKDQKKEGEERYAEKFRLHKYVSKDDERWRPTDPDMLETIEKTARYVANEGRRFEEMIKEKEENNPQFRFLFEKCGEQYHYQRLITQFIRDKRMPDQQGSNRFHDQHNQHHQHRDHRDHRDHHEPRKRSRWGEAPPQSNFSSMHGPSATGTTGSGGSDALRAAQEAAARLASRVGANAGGASQNHNSGGGGGFKSGPPAGAAGVQQQMYPVQYNPNAQSQAQLRKREREERDTYEDALEGVIEGGTWEHRKRAAEMQKTAELAAKVTELNQKKHHIGDFLPKQVLKEHLVKSEILSQGGKYVKPDDFEHKKLTVENKGYQMLAQSQGWEEGKGLGAGGAGRVAPVNMNANTGGKGLGAKDASEVQKGDDEFEQYRKRMALAYTFRPNPLNNPRRSYDGYSTAVDPNVIERNTSGKGDY
eukprot:GFYU01009426.1.p1 GENE.GFYU01009426.1~~GFYU01009426.1.p1  ORF type:complete len:528 (+),score=94.23 GFYU01009426.1:50-1585(+)